MNDNESPKALLEEVSELLDVPEAWVQDIEAKTEAGQACDPESPDACRFCLAGALKHAAVDYPDYAYFVGMELLAGAIIGKRPKQDVLKQERILNLYNDMRGRTFGHVQGVIKRAIAAA